MMIYPLDYYERVYAGVLGKIVGVYLGRLFEGWTYEQIMASFGEIQYYVNAASTCLSVIIFWSSPMTTIHSTSHPRRLVRLGSTTSLKIEPSYGGVDLAIQQSILLIYASRME